MKTAKELKELSIKELEQYLSEIQKEILSVGCLHKEKVEEKLKLKPLRKTRARILTFMNQKKG